MYLSHLSCTYTPLLQTLPKYTTLPPVRLQPYTTVLDTHNSPSYPLGLLSTHPLTQLQPIQKPYKSHTAAPLPLTDWQQQQEPHQLEQQQ